PTTFGAVSAGWAQGVWEAADNLERALTDCSAAQLGGAVGTLASLQEHGPAVATAFAAHLDLSEPVLPWHTDRGRVVALAAAFGRACGAVGTVAHDVILLAQTEVGEVSEEAGQGVGGSSTMPHKRNPIAAVSALAAARQATGSVATLMTTQIQEHQRAAGPWHAEWLPLTELLRRTGSAVSWMRTGIERLRVHPDRMRANLEATGGLALSERITTDLTPELGRMKAHRLVTGACTEAADSGRDLAQVLAEHLEGIRTREQVAALLDPADHLGSAPTFTDRVIAGTTGRAGTAVHHSDNDERHDERLPPPHSERPTAGPARTARRFPRHHRADVGATGRGVVHRFPGDLLRSPGPRWISGPTRALRHGRPRRGRTPVDGPPGHRPSSLRGPVPGRHGRSVAGRPCPRTHRPPGAAGDLTAHGPRTSMA